MEPSAAVDEAEGEEWTYVRADGEKVVRFLEERGFKARFVGSLAYRGFSDHDIDLLVECSKQKNFEEMSEDEVEQALEECVERLIKELELIKARFFNEDSPCVWGVSRRFGELDIWLTLEPIP